MHPLLRLASGNVVQVIFLAFIWKSINYSSALNALCPYILWSVRRVPCLDKLFLQVECLKRQRPHLQLVMWRQSTNLRRDFFGRECKCSRKFFSNGGEIVKVIGNYEELNTKLVWINYLPTLHEWLGIGF